VASGSHENNNRNGVKVSAYQVNRDTIDLLVSVLIEWGGPGRTTSVYTYGELPNDPELLENTEPRGGYNITRTSHLEADALGRELIDANVSSLLARYKDPDNMPGLEMCGYFAETYTWRRVTSDAVSVPRAMGAVRCYRYQACEHDGWRGSFADELSARVMDKLVDLISEGWNYERPANEPQIVSIMGLIAKHKGGK
jgi:hypothetical protein